MEMINFKKLIYTLAVLLPILGNSIIVKAQYVLVQAKLDTTAIEIGDQVWLNLSIEQGKKDKISFPAINDTIIKGIDVIQILQADTQNISGSRLKINKKVLVSAYDFGSYNIPAFEFLNDQDTLYSNTLNLIVNLVKLDSAEKALIDTTQDFPIFDIKLPINTPWTFKEFFQLYHWYIVGLLLIVALAFLINYYLKRRKKNLPLIKLPEKPKEPAHLIALRALENLKEKKLWQKGFEKEYYLELSDIIRAYIENRFQIPTFERTSHELMEIIKHKRIISENILSELNQLLTMSDLAKFAKYKPLPNENDLSLKNTYHFVEQTKLEEKTPDEVEQKVDDESMNDTQDKL